MYIYIAHIYTYMHVYIYIYALCQAFVYLGNPAQDGGMTIPLILPCNLFLFGDNDSLEEKFKV